MNNPAGSRLEQFAVGPWWLLYSGSAEPTEPHSHYAYQLVVHAGAPLVVDAAGHPLAGPIVVIEPGAPHAFRDHRDQILIAYITPDSSVGRQLETRRSAVDPDGHRHPVATFAGGLRSGNWSHADETVRRVLAAVCEPRTSKPMSWWRHPAIDAALPRLGDHDDGAAHLAILAADVGLQSSRLAQVLTDEIGMPVGSYVRWMRLINATEQLAAGAPIGEAARNAGYSDSAHFSRTFRSMFGLDPTDAVASAGWLSS